MSYSRLGLAALGGMVASFACGFLVLWLAPALLEEGHKYPAVFRPEDEMLAVMPVGIVATFLAILVAAVIFARIHPRGSGAGEGARFGVLMGSFVVCAFVLHNYVNLNIGLKLALGQAAAYFVQWTIIGIVLGLVYRPSAKP
jgi:predicted permease